MSTGHEIAVSLRVAYLSMHRQTEASLAGVGITADQFVLLNALADTDGIMQQELVRRASSDPNTIRTMLLLLERRGLVERRRHPTDGRARLVTLTATGRTTHERAWAALRPLQARMLAQLPGDEAAILIGLLTRMASALAPADKRRARRVTSPARQED